ncbi:unnamed protein product [Withania somnifera]
MDFMKVFDQAVREIKREVNLKVLKVPEIEQKVLDATDDEPWGPHGTALADIAQATKIVSECQMVMNVLWTRLTETGKNWRYVYKSLAVIEYLVAHGSERAVDEIVEHTYQISSLTSFEYVEPNGKDVGINVRKKQKTLQPSTGNSDQVDLFGQNLIGDLLDAPTPVPADNSTVASHPSEVDLFADANFVSAKPESKISVDLFASQPSSSPVASSTVDFFAAPDPVVQPDVRSPKPVQINTTMVDPFAAVPLNNFDNSDPFGAFVSPADPTSVPNESATGGGDQLTPSKLDKSPLEAKPIQKMGNFQVISGIWADSLSRGLIDLNIAAPTKVNLADVGIVGGLTDGSDVKEKGPTTFYMGKAMGQGTKLGQSGFTSTATGADDFFSSNQNYQFGSSQK